MLATQLVQGRKTMAVNSTMKESIKAISDRLQKRPLILIDTIVGTIVGSLFYYFVTLPYYYYMTLLTKYKSTRGIRMHLY